MLAHGAEAEDDYQVLADMAMDQAEEEVRAKLYLCTIVCSVCCSMHIEGTVEPAKVENIRRKEARMTCSKKDGPNVPHLSRILTHPQFPL